MPSSITQFDRQLASLKGNIDQILKFASDTNCSDVFITETEQPYIARYGMKYRLNCVISEREFSEWSEKAISSENNAKYVRNKMLDFSYQLNNYRYRASAGFSRGHRTCVLRMITAALPTFKKLGIDDTLALNLKKAFKPGSGISLICGVTGSGKSSTLASCINMFSQGNGPLKDVHMITLEDPIEYLYPSTLKTRIMQKELGQDFMNFPSGIKQALREHPDEILIGETRDQETIRSLVESSRTGETTITTFHTGSCGDTISRLSANCGDDEGLMYDLIANLRLILCQYLLKGRKGVTLDTSFMFFNNDIKKACIKVIDSGQNISTYIDQLVLNQGLQKAGITKPFLNGTAKNG